MRLLFIVCALSIHVHRSTSTLPHLRHSLAICLQANDLSARLGEHADEILSLHTAERPMTMTMSADANVEWEGDDAPPRRSGGGTSVGAAAAGSSAAPTPIAAAAFKHEGTVAAAAPAQAVDGTADEVAGATSAREAGDAAYQAAEAAANGGMEQDAEADSTTTVMTRRILMEHREFARMYLAVRQHLLLPGLTEEEVAADESTAVELELHMAELRGLMSASFVAQG